MSTSNNHSTVSINNDHNREFCTSFLSTSTKGIWFDNHPLNHPCNLLMAQIILVVIISRVLHCFLKPLGQTKFACNLMAGIILGPSGLGYNKDFKDALYNKKRFPVFDTVAQMGIIYSVFLIALKFDVRLIRKTAKTSWKISLASFLCPMALTFGLIYPLARGALPGFTGGKVSLVLSTSTLSFTYFPVVAQALDELNLMASELGQLALSSAMLNDFFQWFLMTFQFLMLQKDAMKGTGTFLALIALVLFTIFVARPLMLLIIKETPEGKDIKEMYICAIQLGVLVMAFISDFIGMKHITGPLILGLVIPDGQQLAAPLIAKTEFVVSEFLLPLYFFRIGMSIDVFTIRHRVNFTKFQAIIVVFYVAKIVGIMVAGLLSKISLKNSLVLAMMLNVKGIVELMIYHRWVAMKIIDDQFFTQIMLSLLAMTMVVTPIVRFWYNPYMGRGSSAIDPLFRFNLQSMPSTSEMFRILCCVHNEESVRNIITLLEASNPKETSPITVYVVNAVEFIGRASPLLVPYTEPVGQSDTPTSQMMRAFENYSKNSRGPVVIQAYTMVAPYKSMHQPIFRLAQDKLVPLVIIPFHENHQSLVGSAKTSQIRQFNINLQAYSGCTVGILVDRGLICGISGSKFFLKLAVFFIGGPDDREALAYASRMSENPDVNITVFRIVVQMNKARGIEEEKTEFNLDESLINEFKLRNIGNDQLNWHDIEVDDGVQVMSSISNSQGQYDLVMVGRRHSDVSLRNEGMVEFMQNPELGVIGDMLASSDFCGGMASVLVMQESRDLGIGAFRNDSRNLESRFKLSA